MKGDKRTTVRLPFVVVSPLSAVMRRVFYAACALLVVFLLVAVDLDGYKDNYDGKVSLLDALYYATVTVSTTGYGDITPVTPMARLVNIVAITPLRVVFLVILVGTTLEVLTRRTREEIVAKHWRSRLKNHTIVVGYGTKGRAAIRTLIENDRTKDSIIVIDPNGSEIEEANNLGLAGVIGDGTRSDVLNRAAITQAREVIVATQRDDTTALVTLTARQLNPKATIVAAVREAENDPLVRQGGADVVITSSDAAGRMLGIATQSPAVSSLIDDFLVYGSGLDLYERPIAPHEVGRGPRDCSEIVVAVVRKGEVMTYADPRATRLLIGDRLVVIHVSKADETEK
ncbi:potassium channel family protein [Sinosporangium siamense]|uniref:NAD-binding protein of Kef-type K+ transporter n=1 Tax=Sinosporangium siamense TaxID=1367973 RepID=A0A919RGA3_9ACTN|nr:potassium channel family protein [Sinosporangium siamense]GII93328.1 NAD-binding protein of Kef-type K+ transporter [Sinosporangium siamense]